MGRHAIVSSPLRTPAVLVGVPVATVLATFGTTAVLGGVVPSAEEAPLRAEAPGEVVAAPGAVAPRGAPSAPPASLDTSLLPSADVEPGPSPRIASSAAPAADARLANGPRVVRVVRAAVPAAAPVDGPRARDADDEHDDGVTSAATTAPLRDAEPRLAPRAVTAASPVESVAERSPGETDRADRADQADADGSVVDLDTPSGGLSVLTFG